MRLRALMEVSALDKRDTFSSKTEGKKGRIDKGNLQVLCKRKYISSHLCYGCPTLCVINETTPLILPLFHPLQRQESVDNTKLPGFLASFTHFKVFSILEAFIMFHYEILV